MAICIKCNKNVGCPCNLNEHGICTIYCLPKKEEQIKKPIQTSINKVRKLGYI